MSESYAKMREAADVTRHGGKVLVTFSFLAGLGLGLLLLGGSEQQFASEEPAITMAQQFMQATRLQPMMARPIAAQSSRQVMGPIAASASDDAGLGRREALAAGVGAAFSVAAPAFAAAPAAPAASVIAPFPVKGDPKTSLYKIANIIKHSFGSGYVREMTPTSVKADLLTSERVYSADLGYGEKLKVGEQKMEHIFKDKVEFTYNPSTNVIDVALKDVPTMPGDVAQKASSSKPGYGAKIVEGYRQKYMGGGLPVGPLWGDANPTRRQDTPPTRQMRTPKPGTVLPAGMS